LPFSLKKSTVNLLNGGERKGSLRKEKKNLGGKEKEGISRRDPSLFMTRSAEEKKKTKKEERYIVSCRVVRKKGGKKGGRSKGRSGKRISLKRGQQRRSTAFPPFLHPPSPAFAERKKKQREGDRGEREERKKYIYIVVGRKKRRRGKLARLLYQ